MLKAFGDIDALLARMNRPGPRYTSYPTVPNWSAAFGEMDYRTALEDLAGAPEQALAVYIHLPFCAERCYYCGCNALVTRRSEVVDVYLDRLEQEMRLVTGLLAARRRVIQVHWGGGTPNFLQEQQARRLMGLIEELFAVEPGAEVSFEADPRIATPQQFALFHELGFNRVSLGVQDFDPHVQQAIGRIQPEAQTVMAIQSCREHGFGSVNADMVYGLPGQTEASFLATLETLIALAPDRVACYSYAHLPQSRTNQKQVDTTNMPDAATKLRLLDLAIERLTSAGYIWIGMDHFAKPDDELAHALHERRLHRNFMGYTVRPAPHMLAFGMSGISELGDCFAQNDAKLGNYQKAILAGHLPIVRGLRLSQDDIMRRTVINHVMCNLEIPDDLRDPSTGLCVMDSLQTERARLEPHIIEGLLRVEPGRLVVTDLGRFFLRNIAMEFDTYLRAPGKAALFSQTV